MENLKIEVRVIDPEMAASMLKRNSSNRPINSRHVKKLSRDMKEGRWMFDGNPISFNSSDLLLNGQHRLSAIIDSDTKQKFLVLKGLDTDSFKVMDTGKNRSAQDVFSIDGIDLPSEVTSSVRLIMYYNEFGSLRDKQKSKTYSNAEILEFAKEKEESLRATVNFIDKFKKSLISRSTLIALHFIFKNKHSEEADMFIRKFCTGLALEEDDVVYILRQRFISDQTMRSKIPFETKVAMFIKAWNIYREGKKVNRIIVGDQFPIAI